MMKAAHTPHPQPVRRGRMDEYNKYFPEISVIQTALLEASQIIGEDKLPESIKVAWQMANKLDGILYGRFMKLKRDGIKQYREGRHDGFKEGWEADPLKIENNSPLPKRRIK
jgi:hypothetical protein